MAWKPLFGTWHRIHWLKFVFFLCVGWLVFFFLSSPSAASVLWRRPALGFIASCSIFLFPSFLVLGLGLGLGLSRIPCVRHLYKVSGGDFFHSTFHQGEKGIKKKKKTQKTRNIVKIILRSKVTKHNSCIPPAPLPFPPFFFLGPRVGVGQDSPALASRGGKEQIEKGKKKLRKKNKQKPVAHSNRERR